MFILFNTLTNSEAKLMEIEKILKPLQAYVCNAFSWITTFGMKNERLVTFNICARDRI